MDKITVVVPCYNESCVLTTFYDEIKKIKDKLVSEAILELLFVDDGSSDETLSMLRRLSASDKTVKYISFSRNFGKEAAIYAGLKEADGDFTVIMDADMQDPPKYIIEMYNMLKLNRELDCVAAKRITRAGEPPVRTFLAHMFYRLINKVSEVEITDGARDYRMMRRNVVDAVLALSEKRRFSKGIFSWVGFNTGWIEYENISRAAGDTKWSLWGLMKYAFEGIMAFSVFPLLLPLIPAVLFLVSGIVLFIIAAVKGLSAVSGIAAAPASLIFFVSSVILFSVGIIGGYMSKIYSEVKSRPTYLLKEKSVSFADEAEIRIHEAQYTDVR